MPLLISWVTQGRLRPPTTTATASNPRYPGNPLRAIRGHRAPQPPPAILRIQETHQRISKNSTSASIVWEILQKINRPHCLGNKVRTPKCNRQQREAARKLVTSRSGDTPLRRKAGKQQEAMEHPIGRQSSEAKPSEATLGSNARNFECARHPAEKQSWEAVGQSWGHHWDAKLTASRALGTPMATGGQSWKAKLCEATLGSNARSSECARYPMEEPYMEVGGHGGMAHIY